MMRVLQMVLLLTAAVNVTACGNRGKLKTPAQIQAQEAKKAARQAQGQQGMQPETMPETMPEPKEARPAEDKPQAPATRVFPVTPSNEVAQ